MKIYILEYSQSQQSFHTTTIDDCCSNNINLLQRKQNHDFHLVGWSTDRVKINKLSDTLRDNYPDLFK